MDGKLSNEECPCCPHLECTGDISCSMAVTRSELCWSLATLRSRLFSWRTRRDDTKLMRCCSSSTVFLSSVTPTKGIEQLFWIWIPCIRPLPRISNNDESQVFQFISGTEVYYQDLQNDFEGQRGGFEWSVYCRSPVGMNCGASGTPLTYWNIPWRCHSQNYHGDHRTTGRISRRGGRPRWMFCGHDAKDLSASQWRTFHCAA